MFTFKYYFNAYFFLFYIHILRVSDNDYLFTPFLFKDLLLLLLLVLIIYFISLIIISELGIADSLVNMLPTGSDNSGGSSSGPGGSSSGPGGSGTEPPKPSGSGLPQSTSNNSITSDVSYTDDDIITTHDLRMRNINILIDNNNKLTEDEKKCLKTLYTEMAEESKKAKQELSRFKNSGNLPMIFKK